LSEAAAGGLEATMVGELLTATADRTPANGGGPTAALAAALGAALAGMAARFAEDADAADRADALRRQAVALAEADAAGYAPVLEAIRLPRDDPEREARVRDALSAAADIPLEIAELAADVAALARRLAGDGKPALRGDALSGADLAAGACRAAARLVEIDLEGAPDDPRLARARAAVAAAG
jgi:formiminotetrahydrofolate cyclodeaminase